MKQSHPLWLYIKQKNAKTNMVIFSSPDSELSDHKRKIEYLEEINQRCTQALKKTHGEVQELQYEVHRHAQDLVVRDREIQERKREIRKKREEMVLLKGHLEIISGSLDEQNPAKNLIASLLKNFSSAHEASFS